MRNSWLSIVVLVASAGAAQAEHRSAASERAQATARTADGASLSQTDIDARVRPVSAGISKCYVDATASARAGGELRVELAIHRRGKLDGVSVSAPGLPATVAHRIEACVRNLVAPLEFPARRTGTTAVLPFYFQRTDAPGAGPQLSCWSSRGCPGQ
jgi:outer membrane biosynthesis protein TonB